MAIERTTDASMGATLVPFALRVTRSEAVATVTASGELDLATVGILRAELSSLTWPPAPLVVVDVERLAFIDCGGVAEFLRARTILRTIGGDLVLRAPTAACARVLELVGLADLTIALESSSRTPATLSTARGVAP